MELGEALMGFKVKNVQDAYKVCLQSVEKAEKDLRGDLGGRMSDREREVAQRSRARGDGTHFNSRMS
jgi:hypothetical protein